MVKATVLAMFCASGLSAADFTLTIGNPIAANMPRMKSAGLAVRLENCADLSKAGIVGVAEGLVGDVRQSIPVELVAGTTPGIYVVPHAWPVDGTWLVNLKATCGEAKAGALVPFRGTSFWREGIQVFARFATAAEVAGALKDRTGGTK